MQYCEHLLVAFIVSILVSCCCMTNYHKLSGLMQYTFTVLSLFLCIRSLSLAESLHFSFLTPMVVRLRASFLLAVGLRLLSVPRATINS